MKRKHILSVGLLLFFLGVTLTVSTSHAKTYTVSPKTKPCDKTAKYGNYNKNTKHFYMLRSYLNKITKQKGGTLVLKKGTYNIPNTLFVSSKTKIVLKEGAVLKKTKKGGPLLKASSTIFQLISESKKNKKGAYGKHNGEHDISITGAGTIDLNKVKTGTTPVIGIVMGHNKNITFDGITFKNMCYGHMIEMDACQNVTVKNCTFTGHAASGKWNKEAINLDVPDPNRDGFNAVWSKKDKTPNETVVIDNCVFNNLETGVGTHRYTGGVYQLGVSITNCTFTKCQTAVRILNYKDPVITDNTFRDCDPNDRYPYSLFFAGLRGITFARNSFEKCCYRADAGHQLLQFWTSMEYDAKQTIYDPVHSEISREDAELFATNTAKNCGRVLLYGGEPYEDVSLDFSDYTNWAG